MPESATRSLTVPTERPVDEGGRPASVLVVDDDDWIRDLLCCTLLDFGYCVRKASSAEEALDQLHSSAFDLVLSDVKMPGMDGIALSRCLSQTHPGLPVVLLTGCAEVELARSALRHGATDYITKPFDIDSLSIVVERNLERLRIERKRALEQDFHVRFQVIQALAAAMDAKQTYTARHSRHVTSIAGKIGERMGLSWSEMRFLKMAAQVHDVGKIGVPDVLLDKAGELTPQEWEVMRTHPGKGAEIIGQVPELAYVADIVRHHHERMDGTGYPDGLRGQSIPHLARIIAVADAFEAMTSHRAYRSRLPVAEAVRRLQEAAGTQFDENVVQVFLLLHSEGSVP
jgi:putative two-component system response regulator